MDHFGHSSWTFVRSKCKGSSLRWQCWMRLWGRFSHNMVMMRSSPSFRMLSQFCRIPFTTSRPPKKRSGRAASSRFFGPMLALGNIARYYFPCFKAAAAAAAATGQYFIDREKESASSIIIIGELSFGASLSSLDSCSLLSLTGCPSKFWIGK